MKLVTFFTVCASVSASLFSNAAAFFPITVTFEKADAVRITLLTQAM